MVGGELFVFVLLLQGLLALLQDGGDLALHEGPGHVGPGQRAALSAGAEDLCIGSLLLDGLRGTRETELVVTDSRALNRKTLALSPGDWSLYLHEMCVL